MNGELTKLLKRYGTTLEETRKLVPRLTEAVRRRRKPAIPTAPQFFRAGEAKEFGIEIDPDWILKVTPGKNGEAPTLSLVSPKGEEVEEYFVTETGRWITRAEKESFEAGLEVERARLEEAVSPIFPKLFPEFAEAFAELTPQMARQYIPEVMEWAFEEQEAFLERMATVGRTAETEALLRLMGADEEYIEELFTTMALPETPIAITEEGANVPVPWWETAWKSFAKGIMTGLHGTRQALFTVILPNLYPYVREGSSRVTGMSDEQAQKQGFAYTAEEAAIANQWIEERRSKFREVAVKQEIGFENWLKKHPELAAKPEYAEDPFKNPALLKDPGWWVHTMAETTGTMLPALVTGLAVTFTTKHPLLGAITTATVMTPLEMQDLYKDLVDVGAPVERAEELALIIGAAIGAVEIGPSLILMKAVYPVFKPFRRGLQKAVVAGVMRHMLARGVKNFTAIEVTEALEEVLQGIIHDYTVSWFDENREVLAGIPGTIIRTLVGVLPLAIFGGGMSMRHVPPDVAETVPDTQKKAEGWDLYKLTGEWYKPEKIVDTVKGIEEGLKEEGLDDEQARLRALNEAARTAEGERAISEATGKIKKGIPIKPKIAVPEVGRAERERLAFIREDLARVEREAEAGTIPRPVANKQIEGLNLEIANLERQLEGIPEVVPEITEAEEVYLRIGQMEMEVAGLKEWLATEPAMKLINLIKKTGWYKGEVTDLTKEQYRKITGKEARASIIQRKGQIVTVPAHTTQAGKYIPEVTKRVTREVVRWEYALDDIATEMGYESGDALKAEIERAGEALTKIKELEAEIALPPEVALEARKPLTPLPDTTAKEAATNLATIGRPALTPAQVTRTLGLFGKYVASPSAENAWALTRELRRETRAKRAGNLKARSQQLIIEKGITPEEAIRQAIRETMSGELPVTRTDYLDDLTQEMRDALFSKVYHTLKEEPFEMMSTAEALTNALLGKPIPREPGVRGGSAYTRLERVFGEQPQVFKAIDKGAKEKKPLPAVIEGLYMEVGKPPLPIDPKMADWLRSLKEVPYGIGTLFEKPSDLQVSDLRTPAELEYAQRKLDLDIQLTKGEITKDTYDIEVAAIYAKAYPKPPIPPYEPPIDKAIKQVSMWPRPARDNLIRVLKEIGWSPIDIGNFIRANKASFDMSFWRQQGPLIANHPVSFVQANIEAWKALWSQKAAEASWERITRDPLFHVYEQIDIDFLRPLELKPGTSQWRGIEEFGYLTGERTIPRLTQKIPHVKLSARAFVTGCNEHNWRIFKNHYEAMLRMNEKIAAGEIKLKPGESFSILKEMADMARMLTDFTQRASLGKVAGLAPALNSLIFAPRATLGRFLTPRHLVSANPRIRVEAWRNLTTFVATVGGIVLLGNLLGLWEVEKDPHSAEFMSIRIGNIRLDPWAGYRQFLVFYVRIVTGTGISSVTGAEYETDPIRAMTTFVRGKAAPLASIILDFWTGKNFIGEEVDVANKMQWAERMAPFAIWDVYEAYLLEPTRAAWMILPAIVGAGVQTYTGDWVENFPKLGLPKYSDNLAYGLTEPVYDVKDFWSDTSSQFAGVDPATLTEAKGFPPYIRAIAEARIINEHLKTLPNEKLHLMNADPEEGLTFADYHQMWRDREKLVAAGDDARWTIRELKPDGTYKEVVYKGEKALAAFDKDERTKNAQLGNFSQRQFSLLNQYHAITDEDEQAEFLEKHRAEIGINPKRDWLKSNPKENAQLAAWGQAKILSLEAYKEVKRLLQELDIPDAAIPEFTLPPEGSIETHFAYEEFVSDGKHGSWEAQLLLLKDAEVAREAGVESYADWHDLKLSDTPIASLELKVANRELFDEYDAYGDEDSSLYLESIPDKEHPNYEKGREYAREQLRLTEVGKGLQFRDIEMQIKAIEAGTKENPTPESLIKGHVEYGRKEDDYGASSAQVMLFRFDNPDYNAWRTNEDIWGDEALKEIDESRVPIWRIDERWQEQDDWYNDGIPEKYKGIENVKARDKAIADEREAYLASNSEYHKDRYRRKAHGLTGPAPDYEEFPKDLVETYVEYFTTSPQKSDDLWFKEHPTETFYGDDWWLIDHMDFYNTMVAMELWEERDLRLYTEGGTIPTKKVFEEYKKYHGLPLGTPQYDFRARHPDLDAWGVLKFGWEPIAERGKRERPKTPWELAEEAERFKEKFR